MKKKIVYLCCIVIVVGLWGAAVGADWYDCVVISAGSEGKSKVLIQLFYDDGDESFNINCVTRSGREKEMLAIALTAMANSMMVKVAISDPSAEEPTIKSMYLLNQTVP